MPKKQNKNKKFRFLLPLLIVLAVAGIGAYWVLYSSAAQDDNDSNDGCQYMAVHGQINANGGATTANGVETIPIGVKWGNVTPSCKDWQIAAVVTSNSKVAKYIGFSCGTVGTCRPSQWDVSGASVPAGENHDLKVCINMPHRNSSGVETVFNVHYRNLAPPAKSWLEVFFGAAPGRCDANPAAAGVYYDNGSGSCSESYTHSLRCNYNGPSNGLGEGYGTGFSPADLINGSGKSSGGAGQGTSSGAGGGGGGSSANKQANEPNSLPSSANQGEQKNQKVEPSPFFDGKEFKPGSDSDNLLFGTTTVGGQKIVKLWIYAIGILFIVGCIAAWRFWSRPKHTPKRKK